MDNKRSDPIGFLTTPCDWLRVCWNNVSFGQIWALVPNFNIPNNSILIVDKFLFTYLGWLGISRLIHPKPPNYEVFRSGISFFQFVNARESSAKQREIYLKQDQFGRLLLISWPLGEHSELLGRSYYLKHANCANTKMQNNVTKNMSLGHPDIRCY